MILTLLREETRRHHERAERAVDLPARLGSLDRYSELLGRLYGFYAPLETHLGRVREADSAGLDLPARLKAPLLHADLLALGRSPATVAALPRCAALPTVSGLADAFGCLYVMEGATLGGQVVRRQAGQTLGIGPDTGCAFFSSYRERVGEMWDEFRAALTDYAGRRPGETDRIVASATVTFARFEEWVA